MNNSCRIIDFGLSIELEDDKYFSDIIGTSFYIAPEVLAEEYNEKCDIWSLGVIMYALLSNKPPFDGHTDLLIMEKVKEGKFYFNDFIWQSVSKDAKELITNMLCFDLKRRYSAREALNDKWFKEHLVKEEVNLEYMTKIFNNLKNCDDMSEV